MPQHPVAEGGAPITGQTILLIEDHADTRSVCAAMFNAAGFRVLEAAHGGEGVQLARKHLPDAVVMDIGMPVVDGLQATELIKQHAPTAHIPVIAITAHIRSFYRDGPEIAGCDAFFTKPCPPDVLLGAIRRLIRVK